jgi:hypothetical protein
VTDRSALSTLVNITLPEVHVVVTNDIGGTELPLAALCIEDVNVSSLAWHFQNRTVHVACMCPANGHAARAVAALVRSCAPAVAAVPVITLSCLTPPTFGWCAQRCDCRRSFSTPSCLPGSP